VRTALVAAVALTSLGLIGPPAQAETWHAPDPRGDVTTYSHSPEPLPCGTNTEATDPGDAKHDITKLAVGHEADTIELRLTLGELRVRDSSTNYMLHVLVPRGAFLVSVVRFKPGKPWETVLSKELDLDSAPADECGTSYVVSVGEPCEGLTAQASPARDQIEVVLPRSCVKDPRWVKVGASVVAFAETDTSGASAVYSDHWAQPGDASNGYPPPYGPRVHRG
jgi:hypothetical protein